MKKKVNYIYFEEFKTRKANVTDEDLKNIFNKKYFNTIMRIEKIRLDEYKYDHNN